MPINEVYVRWNNLYDRLWRIDSDLGKQEYLSRLREIGNDIHSEESSLLMDLLEVGLEDVENIMKQRISDRSLRPFFLED